MNKNTLFLFLFLFLGGIVLMELAFAYPPQANNFLIASLQFTPPQCPFHLGLTPNQVKTNSELSLKQEAILLKLFFTQAILDSRGVAICKETDSLNTCLARFQNLCYQQGKCEEQYDGSKDAIFTSEIRSYLCIFWNQKYSKLFTSWPEVISLFAKLNISIPNWLHESFIAYQTYQQQIQQQVQQQQIANQVNESVRKVINPEDRKEKPVYAGSFELGENINLTEQEIKNNPLVLNPDNNVRGNTLQQNQDFNNFTMANPRIRISKTNDGSYVGDWFVMDAPGGLITIKILDKSGQEIYSDQIFSAGQTGVVFKDFTLDKDKIDPNQEYTFIISGANGQKTGTYKFSGEALVKGGSIIDGIITTQYNPKNSYLYYINGAFSQDGKTLSLDLQIGKAAGPTMTSDFKSLVIKTKSGQVIKTITGDELLKALGGGKLNISLDLSNSTDFVFELINSSGNTVEAYSGKITEGGLLQLSQTIKGASGYGSVYDPIVTYATHGYPQGYSISIHVQAAGAAKVQVIDASNPDPNTNVLATYNSGDFFISGSQNKYKQGYSYYVVYYDQNGNKVKTQRLIVTDKSGHIEIQDINEPPSFSKACGGFQIKIQGTIESITIDGKTYNPDQIKNNPNIFTSDFLKGGILGIKQNVTNIIITYIDGLGVQQSATYTVEGGNIVMTDFSDTLVQLKLPDDEKVGNPVELNNGAVLTYYKNDRKGKYYVKVDNYQDLEIESISFGYAPYDNNPLYIQQKIKEFNETGILPPGAQITFKDKNGGSVTINTASGGGSIGKYGPIYVRGDTTITKEEEKIIVDKGIITIPITKVNDENAKKELENNNLYNDPIVQSLINEAKNNSYCTKHTCGFSQGAYTVTINPFTGKITVEVDEEAKEAAEQAALEGLKVKEAKKAEDAKKKRENYENTLDAMKNNNMINEDDYNKLIEEYDKENPPESPPPVDGGGGGGGKIYYTQ